MKKLEQKIRVLKIKLMSTLLIFLLYSDAMASPVRDCLTRHAHEGSIERSKLELEPHDLQKLTERVIAALEMGGIIPELRVQPITFINCGKDSGVNVSAYSPPPNGSSLSAGWYVLFDQRYLRNITAFEDEPVIAMLGHELGHFFGGHFSYNQNLERDQKEIQADKFAGCAAALVY